MRKAISLRKIATFLAFVMVFLVSGSCKKSGSSNCEVINIDLFSLQKDKDLGAATAAQIASDTSYPLLDSVKYASAYNYLNGIRDKILKSGKVAHANDFAWKLKIINKNILNAFCTPGGYIYVYSGLIKYLDEEDDLAGVMGHEMAHADQRHSTKQLQETMGVQTLLQVALGNSSQAASVVANLALLKYSRCHESEADDYSVQYLSGTSYNCAGAASFFKKLIATGQAGSTPVFLSTHPGSDTRVADITAAANKLGCQKAGTVGGYTAFKNSLP